MHDTIRILIPSGITIIEYTVKDVRPVLKVDFSCRQRMECPTSIRAGRRASPTGAPYVVCIALREFLPADCTCDRESQSDNISRLIRRNRGGRLLPTTPPFSEGRLRLLRQFACIEGQPGRVSQVQAIKSIADIGPI
ncbi:unnamed protein product [Somion occarium]|uniref:Uncharacterized protein n=1 Tax=Somion occarium TaxID=3059160 RepID=A0ABP1CGL6_9APHY